jgi:hypothetical protein
MRLTEALCVSWQRVAFRLPFGASPPAGGPVPDTFMHLYLVPPMCGRVPVC